MTRDDFMRVALDQGVKTITIEKARSRNSLTPEEARAIAAEIDRSEADGSRVVVLTGAGGAFGSGAELSPTGLATAGAREGEELASTLDRMIDEGYHSLVRAIRRASLPVIASVDGVAAGVSFSLVLASDIALASERARFIAAFVRIGLIPDGGITFLLQRAVGSKHAIEIAMTGRSVPADEALRLGIVNRVCPVEELPGQTIEVARRLSEGPRNTLAAIKRMFQDAENLTLEQTLREESRRQGVLMTHGNFLEGVTAFLQKRPARFE